MLKRKKDILIIGGNLRGLVKNYGDNVEVIERRGLRGLRGLIDGLQIVFNLDASYPKLIYIINI